MVMKEKDRYRWGSLGRKSPRREKLASSKRWCIEFEIHFTRFHARVTVPGTYAMLTSCSPSLFCTSTDPFCRESTEKGLRGKLHG